MTDLRPDLPNQFPHHSLRQIQAALQQTRTDTVRSYQARANVSMRTPDESTRASAKVQHRRDDSLYIAFSPGLGIEAVRMLVTPDSFFVYERIPKRLSYGSMAYLSAFFPVPRSGEDLFQNMLGLLTPEANIPWLLEADSSYYYLQHPEYDRRYTIDPTIWRVVHYEERTARGALVEERTFSQYDLFDGVFLPRRIYLQRPLDDTSLSIYYRDVTLNPASLSLTLDVRDSAERILIDDQGGS